MVQSVVWNRNGTLFATACTKDKTMRVYDPRSGAAPVHEAHGHDGGKGFHCVFLENDRLVSVGFSKSRCVVRGCGSVWGCESVGC